MEWKLDDINKSLLSVIMALRKYLLLKEKHTKYVWAK